jgi:hypothetical protein
VNLNQEGCERSMQKQHGTWKTFQYLVDGRGKPREQARWPVTGPFGCMQTSSEQFDKLRNMEIHYHYCSVRADSINNFKSL